MPNFRPSSNSSTPLLARLSATHAIKNYPYSYALIENEKARSGSFPAGLCITKILLAVFTEFGSSGFPMKQGSEIAPARRGERGVDIESNSLRSPHLCGKYAFGDR